MQPSRHQFQSDAERDEFLVLHDLCLVGREIRDAVGAVVGSLEETRLSLELFGGATGEARPRRWWEGAQLELEHGHAADPGDSSDVAESASRRLGSLMRKRAA